MSHYSRGGRNILGEGLFLPPDVVVIITPVKCNRE